MYVSFTLAASPMKAWFFEKDTKNFASRPILGWALADSGNPEAVVQVPNAGVGVRVTQFANFVAVLAADLQPTDTSAVDEIFAGISRIASKEVAEEWKSSLSGTVKSAPVLTDVSQPEARA